MVVSEGIQRGVARLRVAHFLKHPLFSGFIRTFMTAFITRTLAGDSEFKKRLVVCGWQVEGRSLVVLSPLPIPPLPAADWIFFSSRHAVEFFFQQVDPLSFLSVKWAALGEATAKALHQRTGRVDFRGNGEPGATAQAFRQAVRSPAVVLFPAARHSRQSVSNLLASYFECLHLEAYDNRPVSDPPRSEADVLVFTSPLNAQAYFFRHTRAANQRVVAIGATTALALNELGIADVETAAAPSEKALAEVVLRF
jgi:uroporphyrinogen-III synthase